MKGLGPVSARPSEILQDACQGSGGPAQTREGQRRFRRQQRASGLDETLYLSLSQGHSGSWAWALCVCVCVCVCVL